MKNSFILIFNFSFKDNINIEYNILFTIVFHAIIFFRLNHFIATTREILHISFYDYSTPEALRKI